MGAETSKAPTTTTRWDPAVYFQSGYRESGRRPFALVLLNQAIENLPRFRALWENAAVRVCADGGANRLYDALGSDPEVRAALKPHCVAGDFDSIREDVREFYAALGAEMVYDADQESTDFGKAVKWVSGRDPGDSVVLDAAGRERVVRQPKMVVVVLGGLGGRVDQSFHSIHALFVAQQEERRVYLISGENITFLLDQGRNEIETPMSRLGPACGILPVAGTARISTEGLQWNLEDAETKFGGMVSTSNYLKEDKVVVVASRPLVFTVEFRQ